MSTVTAGRRRPPLSHRAWLRWLLVACFLAPPLMQAGYDPAATTEVIAAVLRDPLINASATLLVVAKLLLALVAVAALAGIRGAGRLTIAYYAFLILVLAFLQNMATVERFGFVWLVGNTLVQLAVVGWCFADLLRRASSFEGLRMERLWLLVPMALALLMPYAADEGPVRPSLATVLSNEAGVTYCMVTPVVLGLMLLFPSGIDRRTLGVTAFVGLLFGLVNALTWFFLNPADWWMGVLHLPLLLTASMGLRDARAR